MRSATSLPGSPATPTPSSAAQNYSPRTLPMPLVVWSSIRPTIPSRSREERGSADAIRRMVLLLFSKYSGFAFASPAHLSLRWVFRFVQHHTRAPGAVSSAHCSWLSSVDDSSNLIVRRLPAIRPILAQNKASVFSAYLIILVLPLHCYSDERVFRVGACFCI